MTEFWVFIVIFTATFLALLSSSATRLGAFMGAIINASIWAALALLTSGAML